MGSMTGPVRNSPGVSTPGEDAQPSAVAAPPLAWQHELDSAIADIDSRLSHPRRRSADTQPTLPQLGQPEISPEVIDAIASRVSELLRNNGATAAQGEAMADAIARSVTPAAPQQRTTTATAAPRASMPPPLPEPRALPHGIALTIRIRKPLFRFWPFRRRRRRGQAMIMFSDYRI